MLDALYLHIPYCKSRCAYCNFETQACSKDAAELQSYVEALSLMIRRMSKQGVFDGLKTLYLGGGTPSHLGSHLITLLYNISFMLDVDKLLEFTVECNPESFSPELFKDMRACGVNRYSLGVQSFRDEELSLMGRAHSSAEVHTALAFLCAEEQNVSIDLIAGLPGQSMADFEYSLEETLRYPVSHISVYPLSIEKDTRFDREISAGALQEPDEDLQAEMLTRAHERLESAGFEHYEVANFARPQKRSVHNSSYWKHQSYLGLGTSAASYFPAAYAQKLSELIDKSLGERLHCVDLKQVEEGCDLRFTLTDSSAAFADKVLASLDTVAPQQKLCLEYERLSYQESLAEHLMLALRLKEGIDLINMKAEFDTALAKGHISADFVQGVKSELARLEDAGLLLRTVSALEPTFRGWLLGNEMFGSLWACAHLGI